MFVCTLDLEPEIAVLHGNGEYIYRVAIGFDDQTDHVFSAFVIFAPLPGFGDGTGYELVFRIVEAEPDGWQLTEYSDGLLTKRFLSQPKDREAVCEVIYYLIGSHIDEFRPPAVEMMTYTEDLPEAALRKFHSIASLFRNMGYSAGQGRIERQTPTREKGDEKDT